MKKHGEVLGFAQNLSMIQTERTNNNTPEELFTTFFEEQFAELE